MRLYLSKYNYASDPEAPLFQNSRKSPKPYTPISTVNIRYIFKKYLRRAEIPNFEKYSVHSARATFITEALRNNTPVEDVQRTVTHANVSTTLMYDTRSHEPEKSASFKVDY
ncbi:tyrosine-type recombinase/integrase [Pseudoalteromonas sp. JC3]|uniref:tyrosine-type recombinase/integrase n=1 Tax=Pseudoalteromonas sp. JC3 TaxID=2810196 RepID=UPI0013DE4F3C|nr:tyrosine-type recombinase/integrase [Pseudoalteromonas sp. JC3]